MKKKFVGWRRVSTDKQSRSHLGLEAQKSIIDYFVKFEGGELIADYEECHTGTSLATCTELKKAMEHCKREGAILIIAKVDRFRSVVEALQILDYMGEGNLIFCDLPTSDRFSLTLYTALAEREALITSIRTKQALAAKKARGAKLGAANAKHRMTMQAKSESELYAIAAKRSDTCRKRFLSRKDTQAFIKALRNVFGAACAPLSVSEWDWYQINTKGSQKQKILHLMKDYKEIDGTLFSHWNFSGDPVVLQRKLSKNIGMLRKVALDPNVAVT